MTTEAAELSQEQQHGTASPAESLSNLPATAFESDGDTSLRRRITYMMLFRVVLISLVLGATSLLYWLSDEDLTAPNATVIFAIIVATYLLTIVYAVALTRGLNQQRLAYFQLAADLVIASLLIHVTGGAQSAYTFFFPLAVIGGGIVLYREGVLLVALTSALLFVAVSVAGFYQLLPIPDGQRLLPHELEAIQMIRMLGLNLAGIAGVGVLAVNLAGQLERASASLQTERSATANLMSLHEDIVRSLPSGLITVDNDDHVLTINEAADPDVLLDFETFFNKIAPEHLHGIVHTMEGPDDMPAHIKASLVGSSISIPIENHSLSLGTWQGIYLCEFRNRGGVRKVLATLIC